MPTHQRRLRKQILGCASHEMESDRDKERSGKF
jgi:hypothetical protein